MAQTTINIYGEEFENPLHKKVLLFSGGLDSWVAMRLWKPDILVYCAINHRYQSIELASIKQQILPCPLIIDKRLSLQSDERRDAIIPLRNLYLVMIASRYGDRIGMGVLHGEINGDKSHRFRQISSRLLSHCYDKSYWSTGRSIKIEYPICRWTKAELIRQYIRRGFSVKELLLTRSCYSTNKLPCGICSNCIKRFVALSLNHLSENYEKDPFSSPLLLEFKKRWNTFDSRRKIELRKVFKL